ncbi:SDR family oxidoreductase [Streptomyces sp. NBC_01497]|uniref:SDR family oxidoreductase n=1 Tax=Streptomyces sp. NBC_01497 TaxID=2903885 RepID=UPI002E2FF1D3|nr:SDR family oxidoreductase [Streptomyces sp. NBC_01497]
MSAAPCGPLTGRVAVVTGAARGVGAALAQELSRRGALVALIGHEPRELARQTGALPGPGAWWEADVTDDSAMERTAAAVRERLGPASVVVANAGLAEGGPFAESSPATWRRVVEVNLVGSAVTARVFLPDLLATRGYHLQIASLASIGAAPLMSAYCASKAGAESFAHAFQAETAPHGIAVGIAYLNWTDTDMIRDLDRHAVLRELRGHMPRAARRVYTAADVAARLADAAERRSRAVYVPRWLRAAQVARAALPAVVTRVSRRELPRLADRTPFEATGLLGAGGSGDPAGRDR